MADQNADLLKQAEELGIKTDKRWGDERLQQEIDARLAEAPHEQAGTSYDPGAAGYELQGRKSAPQAPTDPLDHDGNGKKGGAVAAKIPMAINRDIWVDNPEKPDEPIRYRRGRVMEFTVDEAMAGLETGALARVK